MAAPDSYTFKISKDADADEDIEGITPTKANLRDATGKVVAHLKVLHVNRKKCTEILSALNEISQSLADLAEITFDKKGRLRAELREGAWAAHGDPNINTGSFLIIDEVHVVPSHRGHRLGLELIKRVLAHFEGHHTLSLLTPGFCNYRDGDIHEACEKDQRSWTREQRHEAWRKQILYWQEADFRRMGGLDLFGRPAAGTHPVRSLPTVDDADRVQEEKGNELDAALLVEEERAVRELGLAKGSDAWRNHMRDYAHDEELRRKGEDARLAEQGEIQRMVMTFPALAASMEAKGEPLWTMFGIPPLMLGSMEQSARDRQKAFTERAEGPVASPLPPVAAPGGEDAVEGKGEGSGHAS
jgi:GNAT superfamily N-acetyltransferase